MSMFEQGLKQVNIIYNNNNKIKAIGGTREDILENCM